MLRRLPIESAGPAQTLAGFRVALAGGSLVLTVALGFPYGGRLALVLGAVALPWALAALALALRAPDRALNPVVAVGDVGTLMAVELAVPQTLGAVRLAALFFFAVHAHFQGERRGLAIAAAGSAVLVTATAIRGGTPITGDLLWFYEASFVVVSIGAAGIVGRLRTAESASRLRARKLTRRTIDAEREVRRRVAEALHDGPVQELIGLDMMLAATHRAAEQGERQEIEELVTDARELVIRNVTALRDEIVDLGPFSFEQHGYEDAVERCAQVWERRYGLQLRLQLERLDLPAETAADLFSVTQEAVANAGRHAHASSVSIDLRVREGSIELRVMDDGGGFDGVDPLGPTEVGHLGLASMRERAELLGGELAIESSERGTKVLLRAPFGRRPRRRPRSGR
jgi:signal transduction histidine kinase